MHFPRFALTHWALILCILTVACSPSDDSPALQDPDTQSPQDPKTPDPDPDPSAPLSQPTPCEGGLAGPYPCSGFDLTGQLDLQALSASSGNDIWGWTDPQTGVEYGIMGLDNGTAFVSLQDPENPRLLGKLPTATNASQWRDIKVYADHAYIVAEASGHGLQVFDLTQLREAESAIAGGSDPLTFQATATYTGFGNAHNIVVNPESAFAYAVGTNRQDVYNGGAHFLDLSDPGNPTAAGGYGANGYCHDAQVVTYQGPDADYAGRELFIGSNEDRVILADVTDKSQPSFIAELTYPNLGYTHQGWFTEDQRFFLLGDELDELALGIPSRTLVFDFSDLDDPRLSFEYDGPTSAIDHNGFVLGDLFYLANYTAGFRLVDISAIGTGQMEEIGYFDTYPTSNTTGFDGAWSVYPYLPSGHILISDMNNGLFVVEPSAFENR